MSELVPEGMPELRLETATALEKLLSDALGAANESAAYRDHKISSTKQAFGWGSEEIVVKDVSDMHEKSYQATVTFTASYEPENVLDGMSFEVDGELAAHDFTVTLEYDTEVDALPFEIREHAFKRGVVLPEEQKETPSTYTLHLDFRCGEIQWEEYREYIVPTSGGGDFEQMALGVDEYKVYGTEPQHTDELEAQFVASAIRSEKKHDDDDFRKRIHQASILIAALIDKEPIIDLSFTEPVSNS